MNYHFKRCLEKKNLIRVPIEKSLIDKELKTAQHDLRDAEDVLKMKKVKWATISAYYAMFHAARALLYSQGYREKSHFCLRTAIKALFIDKNRLEPRYLDYYDTAKELRENADYQAEFSHEGARETIKNAREFLKKARELLQ